jgi:hypothetical protein
MLADEFQNFYRFISLVLRLVVASKSDRWYK